MHLLSMGRAEGKSARHLLRFPISPFHAFRLRLSVYISLRFWASYRRLDAERVEPGHTPEPSHTPFFYVSLALQFSSFPLFAYR